MIVNGIERSFPVARRFSRAGIHCYYGSLSYVLMISVHIRGIVGRYLVSVAESDPLVNVHTYAPSPVVRCMIPTLV